MQLVIAIALTGCGHVAHQGRHTKHQAHHDAFNPESWQGAFGSITVTLNTASLDGSYKVVIDTFNSLGDQ